MTTKTFKVIGMTCDHCVRSVTQALESQDGVTRVVVDLKAGRARVEYDESRVTAGQLEAVVAGEGYEAEEAT
jgi:copper ion binding protein